MWLHPRLEILGPQWGRDDDVPFWQFWGGHGGDEYGNCSVYLITPLIGGVVFFYEAMHFQRDVTTPFPDSTQKDYVRWMVARKYWEKDDE